MNDNKSRQKDYQFVIFGWTFFRTSVLHNQDPVGVGSEGGARMYHDSGHEF